DETGRLNVDGMNIISNDGSNKLNRSRKARVSYKVQRTINASLNAATSTRAVSSNPNFVTRQIQITLKQMLRDFIGIRVNRAKKSGMVNITSSVNSRERSGINTILHELNPLFT